MKLKDMLFRPDDDDTRVEWVYLCPRCSSTDWKMPNPLMGTEGMMNVAGMVHLFFECRSCGHIGIFFKVPAMEINEVKFSERLILQRKEITGLQKVAVVIVYFAAGLFGLDIPATLGLAKKFRKE